MGQDFTLDDFRKQLIQLQKMGVKNALARMPGIAELIPDWEDPEAAVRRRLAMIDAMTAEERADPARIDAAARQRIATAAGTEPGEVERFLSQFANVRDLMRRMANMTLWERITFTLGFRRFRPPPGR